MIFLENSPNRKPPTHLWIAAQIAVVLPLLVVVVWFTDAYRNFSGYTHPADFETWKPIFNPFGEAQVSIAQHWLFGLQLFIAWSVATYWHGKDDKLRAKRHGQTP